MKAESIEKATQNSFTTVRCDRTLLDEAYFSLNLEFQKEGKVKLTRENVVEYALRNVLRVQK